MCINMGYSYENYLAVMTEVGIALFDSLAVH